MPRPNPRMMSVPGSKIASPCRLHCENAAVYHKGIEFIVILNYLVSGLVLISLRNTTDFIYASRVKKAIKFS